MVLAMYDKNAHDTVDSTIVAKSKSLSLDSKNFNRIKYLNRYFH